VLCWPRAAAATTEWRRARWAWQMTALAEYGLYDGLRLQIQASLALLSFGESSTAPRCLNPDVPAK
jgi:hypothetical protein